MNPSYSSGAAGHNDLDLHAYLRRNTSCAGILKAQIRQSLYFGATSSFVGILDKKNKLTAHAAQQQ